MSETSIGEADVAHDIPLSDSDSSQPNTSVDMQERSEPLRPFDVMERRIEHSYLIAEVEKFLTENSFGAVRESSTGHIELDKAGNYLATRGLSDDAQEKLSILKERLKRAGLDDIAKDIDDAINRYLDVVIKNRANEQFFENGLQSKNIESTPENLGNEIFMLKTNSEPDGKVEAKFEDGYVVLDFTEYDDYITFFQNKKNQDEEDSEDEDNDDKETDEDEPVSAGCFSIQVDIAGRKVNVLATTPLLDIAEINIHERQHFINGEVLNRFITIEETDHPTLPDFEASRIKDELLARIRDGSDPERATEFLSLKVYAYLREDIVGDPIPEDVLQEFESVLSDTRQIMQALKFYQVLGDNNRDIITNYLLGTPLHQIPKKLRQLGNHCLYSNIHDEARKCSNLLEEKRDEIDSAGDLLLHIYKSRLILTAALSGFTGYSSFEERSAAIKKAKDDLDLIVSSSYQVMHM